MSKVTVDVGMSLDGFIAGPNAGPQNALGDGGHRIHQWVYDLEAWRERQSLRGGRTNKDDEVLREAYEHVGAFIMGRRMFDEGEIGWPDPPPFQAPVFVLTNHGRAVDKRGRDDLYIRDRWYRERAGAGQRGCGREGREDIRRGEHDRSVRKSWACG